MNYVNLVLECSLILIRKISSKMSTVLNIFYPPIYIVYTIFYVFFLNPPKLKILDIFLMKEYIGYQMELFVFMIVLLSRTSELLGLRNYVCDNRLILLIN